ncbi:class I SAM-dependent methyltransferase [Legionella septentrionalis]|nr:class I SAM-dependent methyltransferase [Legionella septentrionalis]
MHCPASYYSFKQGLVVCIHSQSKEQFEQAWEQRAEHETLYLHWTRGAPKTQIQLAFRQHWLLFQELIGQSPVRGKRCIELGAGRGTISMYFADAGWDCTLLDTSKTALAQAKKAFSQFGLPATYLVGDAVGTNLPDESYDVCVSIGLMEHIPELEKALAEQVRLLSPGGLLLAYVVPDKKAKVQAQQEWVNDILASYYQLLMQQETIAPQTKPEIYRSNTGISVYLEILKDLPLTAIHGAGVYPLPMLSPSTTFPFTLNPPEVEERLVHYFTQLLAERRLRFGHNPWWCEEEYGQAFLISAVKI